MREYVCLSRILPSFHPPPLLSLFFSPHKKRGKGRKRKERGRRILDLSFSFFLFRLPENEKDTFFGSSSNNFEDETRREREEDKKFSDECILSLSTLHEEIAVQLVPIFGKREKRE